MVRLSAVSAASTIQSRRIFSWPILSIADVVMACIVMADVVMAHIVMADVVMAYIVMAGTTECRERRLDA